MAGKETAGSAEVTAHIKELPGWQADKLSQVRAVIKKTLPDVVEEIKWKKPSTPGGVPVWSHDGIICTGETYQDKVKLTFHSGALIEDPAALFNAGFGGNTRRAIDLQEQDVLDAENFTALVRAAAAFNSAKRTK